MLGRKLAMSNYRRGLCQNLPINIHAKSYAKSIALKIKSISKKMDSN